ncbi:hypothetical protein N7519_011365 [Penicillium mononematosum]|uniref:uncharacterized protein n=1 Tax=Penicillium mononematosum TaxID=268346 RepID=UPI002548C084|nr:uncharacterized protein N7519_011365 [Penicillium mononematosum]KAJ6180904.1 hypothetical protein N7519_011365 [Penicillium mononematosum]
MKLAREKWVMVSGLRPERRPARASSPTMISGSFSRTISPKKLPRGLSDYRICAGFNCIHLPITVARRATLGNGDQDAIPDESTDTIWTIRGGYEETLERIAGAFLFSTARAAEPFFTKEIVKRVIQNDVPNGQFIIGFDKLTPWIGKHIQMKQYFRLITCEPANR